jgi:hypothetical protein
MQARSAGSIYKLLQGCVAAIGCTPVLTADWGPATD